MRLVNVRLHMMFRLELIYIFDLTVKQMEIKSLHKLLNELHHAMPHYSTQQIDH